LADPYWPGGGKEKKKSSRGVQHNEFAKVEKGGPGVALRGSIGAFDSYYLTKRRLLFVSRQGRGGKGALKSERRPVGKKGSFLEGKFIAKRKKNTPTTGQKRMIIDDYASFARICRTSLGKGAPTFSGGKRKKGGSLKGDKMQKRGTPRGRKGRGRDFVR